MKPTITSGQHFCKDAAIDNSQCHDVSMAQTQFDDVNLQKAIFGNVNLSGAKLDDVNLSNVQITNANLDGMRIEGVLVTDLLNHYSPKNSAGIAMSAFLHLPTSDVRRMVEFYQSLGFTLVGDIYLKEGTPVFACLELNGFRLRVELWNLPDWETLKKGFAVTTIWIEVDSIEAMLRQLKSVQVLYTGPHVEDYGSREIELFDPEGFRIICAEGP